MKSHAFVVLSALVISLANSTGNTRGNGAIEYREDFNIMQDLDMNMVNSAPKQDCVDYYGVIKQSLNVVSAPRTEMPGNNLDLLDQTKFLLKTDAVALKLHNIFARTSISTLCLGWTGAPGFDLDQVNALKEEGTQVANDEIIELSIAEFLRIVETVKSQRANK